jgi:CDP-glucose 4,6-dehydratase
VGFGPRPLEDVVKRAESWRGKRVFLTGHTGFKGSWLALWLQSLGAEVAGYALAPATRPDLFTLARVGEGMRSIEADIRDAGRLRAELTAFRPEVVLHLAAQSLVRASYEDPAGTWATNVMGTANLLEAVRASEGVRAVVVVTSDKCYANDESGRAWREDDPMGGRDPYSGSKGAAELAAAAWRASFFGSPRGHPAAVATARAGNVIGGGDWAVDRLIPDLMRAAEAGAPVRIRNPEAVRPWQHVLEPLDGYLTLAERLLQDGTRFAEAWNFGPSAADCKPVRWIVERVARAWGPDLRWEADAGEQPHEAAFLRLDSAKAIARLGWSPRWELGRTIDSIVAWHRAHRGGADMRAITLGQVAEHAAAPVAEPAR